MNDYPSKVKEKLNLIIKDMADHHWLFTNNPGHDFSRQHLGKLSFYDTMTSTYPLLLNWQENILFKKKLVNALI